MFSLQVSSELSAQELEAGQSAQSTSFSHKANKVSRGMSVLIKVSVQVHIGLQCELTGQFLHCNEIDRISAICFFMLSLSSYSFLFHFQYFDDI
jgi:hypothetical protein